MTMKLKDQLGRIIELLEDIRRQGDPLAGKSVQDEINAVRLQGRDVYEYFKAKGAALPRRKRTTRRAA